MRQDTSPLQGTATARFFKGLGYVPQGLRYLASRPRLWPLVLAPALVNLLLFFITAWLGVGRALDLLGRLWARPEGFWLLLLWVSAQVVIALVALTLCFVLVWAVSGLVATPFNDRLSEHIEMEKGVVEEAPFHLARFLRDVAVSVGHSALNLGAYLCLMVPVLLLDLVPGLGLVLSPLASWLVTSTFLAREMMDGPLTRRRFSWRGKMALVNRHRPLMLGFGTGAALLLWIPLLNFLCLPVAVAGGTLLFCDLYAAGGVPPSGPDPVRGPGDAPEPPG